MNLYSQIDSNRRRTFFLFFFTFLVIIGLGYIYGLYMGDPYDIALGAFLFSLIYSGAAYFFSDRVVLAISGARPIEKKDNPQLYRTMENLCIGAGLPLPRIYIVEEPAMNAFATGRDPKHAVVAVTQGLLDNLEDEELEGVLAHELSHIQNFDIRTMMFAAVLAGAVVMLANVFLRSSRYLGGSRGRRSGAGILLLIGFLLALISPIIAQLIKLAISRQREFLADSSGALLTRYPEGLARALEKIGADKTPLRHVSEATAHLYIKNPLTAGMFASLFSTHPPVEERIKRLRLA
ncbi:zinc metalloprotease HtpX [candidate division WWE3 bacterium RBG_19FT_COMBO_53_11]|uniref:Protease HtpX homolog n=1 Tax=candidate division WWE3 bacterium RBG_19FT_COMBO_53_11 TaxID=1802613 RepID=A0A1F4UI10_UNCKA|nr:MAG: zinc metalloprotease HtpX [candidate division WWE3 bacterium RBG_16_52_45]OGC44547.1 MAG: zinc metalloprotease HtpX [candidate division WWE3 bacterium RBG_19FT_COMBO_53_11]